MADSVDAVASVAVVDFSCGYYGWRCPFLVEEDLALLGGVFWRVVVTATTGTIFGGFGCVGHGGQTKRALGQSEVSPLAIFWRWRRIGRAWVWIGKGRWICGACVGGD